MPPKAAPHTTTHHDKPNDFAPSPQSALRLNNDNPKLRPQDDGPFSSPILPTSSIPCKLITMLVFVLSRGLQCRFQCRFLLKPSDSYTHAHPSASARASASAPPVSRALASTHFNLNRNYNQTLDILSNITFKFALARIGMGCSFATTDGSRFRSSPVVDPDFGESA